jgi:adenylate kinase
MINNYIILGPPGSGKGTQSKKLVDKFDLLHLSTGSMFRHIAKHDNNVKELITSGHLIPDTMVMALINEYIKNNIIPIKTKGIIFDGFPRTLPQAKSISNILMAYGLVINMICILTLNVHEVINRLIGRRICTICGTNYNQSNNINILKCKLCNNILTQRSDDKVNVIKERFKTYEQQTKPLIEYYNNNTNVYVFYVDAFKDEYEVFSQIKKHIDYSKQNEFKGE